MDIIRDCRYVSIVTLIFVLLSEACIGQQVGLYWENDGTWAKPNRPEDRHYTNGNRLDYAWDTDNTDIIGLGNFLTGRDDIDTAESNVHYNLGLFILQHMQTPDHIAKPGLRHDPEMRYAGLLYGGPFLQIADDTTFDHFEIGIGVLGESAAGKFSQDFIHDMRNFAKAVDWDTQMEDRLALDISWIKKIRFASIDNPNLDMIGESFITAGTVHRHGGLGITARYGTSLPNNFGPSQISSPAYYTDEPMNYLYGFIRLAGRYVEYNQLLDQLDNKDFLGELQAGISFAVGKLELTYSQVFMTRQYEEQPENDSYGSFTCKVRF